MSNLSVLGIDPGPTHSALCWLDRSAHPRCAYWENSVALDYASISSGLGGAPGGYSICIENIRSYGMAVGAETFDTCVIIGRLVQALLDCRPTVDVKWMSRVQIKAIVCETAKANDAAVRSAIIDKYGKTKKASIGNKANPGPLFGVTGDMWAALACALAYRAYLEDEVGDKLGATIDAQYWGA